MSPLAMSGIFSSARTARMVSCRHGRCTGRRGCGRAGSGRRCRRSRPAGPRAALRLSRSQPVRVLSVTGTPSGAQAATTASGCGRSGLRGAAPSRSHVANLLDRAAHVDVDDLGAPGRVESGGLGHHGRVGAGDLDRNGGDLAVVVQAARGLDAVPQLGLLAAISDTAAGPSFLQSCRKGRSVTPAMGATSTLLGRVQGPMRMVTF